MKDNKIMTAKEFIHKRKQVLRSKMKKPQGRWYNLNSILGNDWAMFYILLGAGATGKSYAVMKHCVSAKLKNPKGVKLFWTRLTENQCQKLLENNAAKLLDPDLYRKFGKDLKRKGNVVFYGHTEFTESEKTGKTTSKFVNEGELCQVQPLSTFFNNKGEALFDNEFNGEYYIILDEMNRESGEANRFDVVEAFANQLENFTRQTSAKIRVICIGNNMEEVSDILAAFDFIPRGYGRFKLKRRKCIIDVIEPSALYDEDRKRSAGYILAPNAKRFAKKTSDADTSMIAPQQETKETKASNIICFGKAEKDWFTMRGDIICKYNGEKKQQMAMKQHIGIVFINEYVTNLEASYHLHQLRYDNYTTYIKFAKAMSMNKKR